MILRNSYMFLLFLPVCAVAQKQLQWPGNNEVAVSLSFDDARESQVLKGTSILDSYGVKATFYVVPSAVKRQWEGWKRAVAAGHEIGNHTLTHPCTGNFAWSRKNALEEYDLEKMQNELKECNLQVKELLNVECKVFAYPCGQKFVGKGAETKSYVPLIASLFTSGRGWMDEAPNDPAYLNKDQLTCIESDGKTFEQLIGVINEARKTGSWVIFGGHEINEGGSQTTLIPSLRLLLAYVKDPANGVWIAPVGTVAGYIEASQNKRN